MCFNCHGNHTTMSMKCTIKKAIINAKRKAEIERNKVTYSELTQLRVPQHPAHTLPPPPQPTYNITREETLKINIYAAHAHYRSMESPGCNVDELNKILKANQLRTIIIPDTPDSQHIYTNTTEQQIKTTSEVPQVKPRREKKREGRNL